MRDGVPERYVLVLRASCLHHSFRIMVYGQFPPAFIVSSGARQDCPLFLLFFRFVIEEDVLQNTFWPVGWWSWIIFREQSFLTWSIVHPSLEGKRHGHRRSRETPQHLTIRCDFPNEPLSARLSFHVLWLMWVWTVSKYVLECLMRWKHYRRQWFC